VPRVLHVLSQRPSLTGSGITLDALVRLADAAGWEQRVVVGVPAEDAHPEVGGLPPEQILPLTFGGGDLAFAVPGMSDVMPYPSTRFSEMTPRQLDDYRYAWRAHLSRVLEGFEPDVIHSHHVWLMSALLEDVAQATPVVTQCHATGLRQMTLCPHLADEVRSGCARNDAFLVLHTGHAQELTARLGVAAGRIHVVGAGYRDELFHARGRRAANPARLVYIGKYSAAKGLPWLLDAVERLAPAWPGLELHVAGSGAGAEADEVQARMRAMAPTVVLHGMLSQPDLAELLRTCSVCVLPSFYEGLPLVLVEALACGCRLVATELAGVKEQLAPHMGQALELVPLPRLVGVDTPDRRDLPAFVDALSGAVERSIRAGRLELPAGSLEPFSWSAVFRRVESVWLDPTIS